MFRVLRLFNPTRIVVCLLALAVAAPLSLATVAEAGNKRAGGYHGKGGYSKSVGARKTYSHRRHSRHYGNRKSGSVARHHFGRHGGRNAHTRHHGGRNAYTRRHGGNRHYAYGGRSRHLSPGGRRDGAYGYRGYRHYGGGPRIRHLGKGHTRIGNRGGRRYHHAGRGYGSRSYHGGGALVISVTSGYASQGSEVNVLSSNRTHLQEECKPGEYCVVRLGPEYDAPKIITLNETDTALSPEREPDLGEYK
jgi:hypothetical protein